MAALAENVAQESCSEKVAVAPRPTPRRGRALLAHGAALLLFTLLTITRALPLVLHPASTVTPDPIDPVYNIWAVATADHNATAWPDGLWSLFHANIFYPTPHAGSYTDVFAGLLPFSFPLHLFVSNPVALANVLLALSFILSAYGAFLLGYELTGYYSAALLAGLVFGLCPLHTEHVGHLNVLSAQWLVTAAYCAVRAWRGGNRRWWALTGLLAGLSAVTMLYYLAYLALPLLVVLILNRSWTRRRGRGAGLAAVIASCLIIPFTIPYLLRHAVVTAHYGGAGSTDVVSFLQVMPGRPIDSVLLPVVPWQMMSPNHGFFPGIIPLALAGIAVWRGHGRRWLLFALLCAIIALGPRLQVYGHTLPISLPYAWLSAAVPHFNIFRDAARATVGLYLGLAAAVAWGARLVLGEVRMRGRRAMLGAILTGLVVLELWSPVPTVTLAPIPAGEQWLAHQAGIHTIVELPIASTTPLDWQRQTEIMYDSTIHWKLLVNGSASIDPVGMARTRAILGSYPSPQSLALLRQLHVDAVVLRLAWLSPEQRRAARAACRVAYRDAVEEVCAAIGT